MIDGIKTNIPLHLRILDDPDFRAGHFATDFLTRYESVKPRGEAVDIRTAKAS